MKNSGAENMDINDELEFNNGVGDALKQKEEYTFSWKKTSIILVLGMVVIILATFGVLEVGKSLLNINQTAVIQDDALTIDQPLKELRADANEANWDVLPEDSGALDVPDKANESIAILQESVTPKEEVRIKKTVAQPKKVEIKSTTVAQNTVGSSAKKAQTAKKTIYRVIAGSFTNYNNAQVELTKLKKKGFDGYIWSLTSPKNVVSYKVQVGAFNSSKTAQKLVAQLQKKNIASFISKH